MCDNKGKVIVGNTYGPLLNSQSTENSAEALEFVDPKANNLPSQDGVSDFTLVKRLQDEKDNERAVFGQAAPITPDVIYPKSLKTGILSRSNGATSDTFQNGTNHVTLDKQEPTKLKALVVEENQEAVLLHGTRNMPALQSFSNKGPHWPSRPSLLLATRMPKHVFSFYVIPSHRVILPEINCLLSHITLYGNGTLIFSPELTQEVSKTINFERVKRFPWKDSLGTETKHRMKHDMQNTLKQFVGEKRYQHPILQPVIWNRYTHLDISGAPRELGIHEVEIRLPETIAAAVDLEWKGPRLSVLGKAAEIMLANAVLFVPNSHPVLKEYGTLISRPTSQHPIDEYLNVDILRYHIRFRRRFWHTHMETGCKDILTVATVDLENARTLWFRSKDSRFLKKLCEGELKPRDRREMASLLDKRLIASTVEENIGRSINREEILDGMYKWMRKNKIPEREFFEYHTVEDLNCKEANLYSVFRKYGENSQPLFFEKLGCGNTRCS